MVALKNIPIILLFIFILGQIQPAEPKAKVDVQAESAEKESSNILRWVNSETSQKLFDIDDIVRFDWDKQTFELTRRSAMDFMAELNSLGVQGRKFILKDDMTVIYEGTLVSPTSSFAFFGPIIRTPILTDDIKPPLFKIDGGYPEDFEKNELRFSESLKKALQHADVLSEIDVNNPPPPIEKITHGWFGEKDGLRVLIEVFPETFGLHRSARIHIHLTGGKDLDENHVFDVNATLISKDGKGTFSTKKIFRVHGTDWKNIYVFEMKPWEDLKGLKGRVKTGLAKLSVEVFTREILNEHTKTYSEPIDRVKTDPINVFIRPGRALLPEIPNKVMIRFRKAVRDSDWENALKYCSSKIKSKAGEYDYIESFFKDVLPIDEVTALSEFQVSGRSYHYNEVYRYSCEIRLKNPNYKWPLHWNLSVLKEDTNWVVEFPTKPHHIWVKHEILKSKLANREIIIDPEKCGEGFDIRLIPRTKEFTIGRPMLFRIEMENTSNETLRYTHTSFMVNDPLLIIDTNGIIVPYIDSSYQTTMSTEFIEPGEAIVLVDNYDVRSQYHIIKPGTYSCQFRGSWHLKPSNIVEVDIKPGQLSPLESVVEKLMPILPKDWMLTRKRIRDISDLDSETDRGIVVSMVGKRGRKGESGGTVAVFIVINPSQSFLEKTEYEAELCGQSQWGPVYVKSLDAEQLWPDWKNQITKALGIENPKQNTEVQVEGKGR
jgi:hypothetical protein